MTHEQSPQAEGCSHYEMMGHQRLTIGDIFWKATYWLYGRTYQHDRERGVVIIGHGRVRDSRMPPGEEIRFPGGRIYVDEDGNAWEELPPPPKLF